MRDAGQRPTLLESKRGPAMRLRKLVETLEAVLEDWLWEKLFRGTS